jgi:putative Holliday junction resolvase
MQEGWQVSLTRARVRVSDWHAEVATCQFSGLFSHPLLMNPALGIDHGDARIGLALSDDLRMLAHPLETVATTKAPLDRICTLIRERSVDTVILGLPKNMDGSRGPAAQKVEAFATSLRSRVPDVKVVLWDERMTTVAAQRSLHEAGRNAKNSRSVIDQVAAQLILQGWLDSQGFLAQ